MLVDAADRVFSQEPSSLSAGFDIALWQTVEEAGLDRILLPEEEGGAGDAFEAAVQVSQRFGAHACAIPYIESVVANRCLFAAGQPVPAGPKTIMLPAGATHVSWALDDIAIVDPNGTLLSHVKVLTSEPRRNVANEPVRCLVSDHVQQHASSIPSDALALYATLKAAAMVGALERALELTISYVNERLQFGRKLAAFQAVQHMVAQSAEEVAAAAAAVRCAGQTLGKANALYFAGIAKSRAGEAATVAAAMMHQCHGAIGYTQEYALHLYTYRALAWRDDAGSEMYWNERIGRAALQANAGPLWPFLLEGAAL